MAETPLSDPDAIIAPCTSAGNGSTGAATCTEPSTITILGATGDLTARKLMPALFNLYRIGSLPEAFAIVGCGRTHLTDETFRERMGKALSDSGGSAGAETAPFLKHLYYQPLQYDVPADFEALADTLREIDQRHKTRGNRIFYFALPPTLYMSVARMLGQAGLAEEGSGGSGWSRLVIEKPFGRDLQSAIELDGGIHTYFREHQVFRIDHYLAKETVQNVLMFRFANAIFEPVWNRQYIASVRISATERLGVEHRAGYYEQAGVVRDMFQNHMMQLLSLTAMEPPAVFKAERVRDEKIKVYRALRPFPVDRLDANLVLGQYTAGAIDGRGVPGYREEPGVTPDSVTPTYAMMKLYLDNWRWQGVPFYLVSGKRLTEKRTEIDIHFRPVPHSMFRNVLGTDILANRLILGIYPEEKIALTFQTKSPGARVRLRTVTMDFHYHENTQGVLLDAYEKVLLDGMVGDQTLFWRQDSVETCWAFLTPILEACETCGDRADLLHFYPAGSDGPEAAARL
ncbi:Glucose-6-phosphate 1-dehydrogenase (EC [Olavius algarvensis associated proteobacterium Delta 3]|nr:Glucose-6-phosphate 1-dehydrogenase (EC [Olavius algarvensis associated proteobacterium Delta 3]CAB5155726.1 Glucose-6-phosphate 1-dehydrogenase (EC [Olavius algarvensis associated proteobacterium Delta 3]